jgi:chaperone modulatory protein CbpM
MADSNDPGAHRALVVGVVGVVVEEHMEFSLSELCRAIDADTAQLLALVNEGVLQPLGEADTAAMDDWRFGGQALKRARTALRLARELDIGLAGAAVVMELLDEIDALRAEVRQLRGG